MWDRRCLEKPLPGQNPDILCKLSFKMYDV